MRPKKTLNNIQYQKQQQIKSTDPSTMNNQQNFSTISNSNHNGNENQMPKIIVNSKQSIDHINSTEQMYSLRNEIKKLRGANKQLKKQLEEFSFRLDQSLKKQIGQQHKYKVGQQILESMELRNAYKKCEIYKKQINFLKRKQAQRAQTRTEELQNTINQLQKQKQSLIRQIKDLKKVNKQQQKGLKQMAGPNAIKLMEQNEKLRQSIRRLHMLYDHNQIDEDRGVDKYYTANQNSKRKIRKQKSKNPIIKKHDESVSDGFDQQEQHRQKTQIDRLKNKIIRSNRKVTMLTIQITKLKQHNEQLRQQILDRDKQLSHLRQKISDLRKYQETLKKKKVQTQTDLPPVKGNKKQQKLEKSTDHKSSRHYRLKTEMPMSLFSGKQQSASKGPSYSFRLNNQTNVSHPYPKILQYGYPQPESLKWNDYNFSSKIKQIQVCPNSSGSIKQLHFRYQKGEPPKISKSKYASFCCEENSGEFIKVIKGGFKDGLLRYLFIQSNTGRKASFCQYYLENQCSNWVIEGKQNQYIGAFFGQNNQGGVCRIGCFIEKQK